jgi:hypothetical protein
MAIVQNPSIITLGLQVYMDPLNSRCYSGSGNTAYDLSGTGSTFLLNNNPTYASTGYTTSFNFDGTDDYAECATFLNRTGYTKIAVFQVNLLTAPNVLIGGDATYQHVLWMAGGNKLAAGHNNRSGGSFTRVQTTTSLITNKWYFGAVSFSNSSGYNLYLNQNLEATNGDTSMFASGNATIHIAAHTDDSNLLNGKIAQALVYNRALSQAEILQNYYAFKFRYGI